MKNCWVVLFFFIVLLGCKENAPVKNQEILDSATKDSNNTAEKTNDAIQDFKKILKKSDDINERENSAISNGI